jgi:hypothetical protein
MKIFMGGFEGKRGVPPRTTGGLEMLNYAAGRRVYFEALFSMQNCLGNCEIQIK